VKRKDLILNSYFVIGLIVLIINDFYLKYEYGNFATGKLSDFAGLLIFPMFVASIISKSKNRIKILDNMRKLVVIAFLTISIFTVNAQSFTLRGIVVDEREPIVGASIIVKNTTIGTVTDFGGKFEIILPDTTIHNIIVFSYLGYETQEYRIDAKKNDIRIVLKESTALLKEVVVVGYAAERKSAIVGSIASTSSSNNSDIKSGTLTAGEVNDFAKWHLWGDILRNDFQQYSKMWGFYPTYRYIAQLTGKQGMPVSNAQVTLKLGDTILWQTKTDNTGKAELWRDFFKSETETDSVGLSLVFEFEGKSTEISDVIPFEQGINAVQIETMCSKRNKVDMFFMVDATGSMSDEIRYLQVELDDIIQKIHKQQSELELRVGSLVYRDHGDEYLTRKSSLSGDISETLNFLREQSANGGGDYPEAVDVALEESVANEDWNEDALARILFVVLDAPSHTRPEVLERLETQLRLAAEKGIRIVPIACSDIQKDGEYLMRTFALATNGTYLFLTDDSGVGNAHIKPTTDKYDVEKLNDAIVRVVKQYTQMPDCDNPKWAKQNKNAEPSDKFVPNPYDENTEKGADKLIVSDLIKVYPNPCSDILKIDIRKSEVKDIYLIDMTGKTLYGFNSPAQKETVDFNVHTLSTGIYFVRAFYKGKWFSEKFIKK